MRAASLADASIKDADFLVDPLAVDTTSCGSGDQTTYTGAKLPTVFVANGVQVTGGVSEAVYSVT